MIKTLRNKFILITMLLVTAVLTAVFVVMLFSNYNLFRKESHDEMMHAIDNLTVGNTRPSSGIGQPPDFSKQSPKPGSSGKPAASPKPNSKKPHDSKRSTIDVFTIIANPDTNEIVSFDMGNSSITDEEFDMAFNTASALEKTSGIIRSVSLRFMKRPSSLGDIYAFADMTNEISSLKQQALVMLFVGVGGLIAFFFITLLLSNLAMRPTIEAYTRQKQFIADASHELRTPLTVILANASILSKTANTADQKKWIDSTYFEGIRMKQLIDDMLFLAKSDAHELPSEKTVVNMTDTAFSCVLPFESILLEKSAMLSTDDIDSDIHVYANEAQLKQLINILLDNACKYVNENGKVYVSLKKDADNKAIFEVSNTGTIISEEDLPHIFERFYRADKARSFMSGHGLGLSIADQIVKEHKGKITVKSSAESGTVFTVTIPILKPKKVAS